MVHLVPYKVDAIQAMGTYCSCQPCITLSHSPQSAVAFLARDNHRGHVSTALGVERSLFGLPCQYNTARVRVTSLNLHKLTFSIANALMTATIHTSIQCGC